MSRNGKNSIDGAILLADDHPLLRAGLAEVLKHQLSATRVVEVGCYADVLDHIDEADLRLVIIDLGMPDIVELDAQLAAIRNIRLRRPELTVVIYTGTDDRRVILKALETGVHGYILKSDIPDDLVGRLRYILSGEVYVPPTLARPGPQPVETELQPQPGNGAAAEQVDELNLSKRQMQVLRCLVEGLSNKEIARDLSLAESTVKMHVGAVFRALGVNNRAQAAAKGQRLLG